MMKIGLRKDCASPEARGEVLLPDSDGFVAVARSEDEWDTVETGGRVPSQAPNLIGKTTVEAEDEQAFDPKPHGRDSTGLKLLGLLLQCTECVTMDNLDFANDLLPEIVELSSPYGTSSECVNAYFTQVLQALMVSSCIGSYSPLTAKSLQKIFNAFQSYNSVLPLVKFSHFTVNQAIFQDLDGEDRVHIIDLDIMQGLQWPGLFHILASRSKKIRSVKITGFGSSSELLDDSIGRRLTDFASSLGLPFEFFLVEGKIRNMETDGQEHGDRQTAHS
ncbi:hypothetical protein JHK84_028060 [Glycine max]|nr:hypothetical protein JHK84_028060 [Glycine max]